MQLTRLVFESDASRRATLGKASDDDVWQSVADTLKLDPPTKASAGTTLPMIGLMPP